MPNLNQLPTTDHVNPEDILPISQAGRTVAASVGTLQASLQPAIILPRAMLLGRTSLGAGGPEPIALGAGLSLVSGTLSVAAVGATTSTIGAVKPGLGLAVAADGTLYTTALPFARNAYTASGVIAPTDTLSLLNGAAALSLTLGSGTGDGQTLLIKNVGAANATITGNIDGTAGNVVTLTATPAGTVRDGVRLRWSAVDATWWAE